jgi:hypothetical protein
LEAYKQDMKKIENESQDFGPKFDTLKVCGMGGRR